LFAEASAKEPRSAERRFFQNVDGWIHGATLGVCAGSTP
jgi:hypothetical protein